MGRSKRKVIRDNNPVKASGSKTKKKEQIRTHEDGCCDGLRWVTIVNNPQKLLILGSIF